MNKEKVCIGLIGCGNIGTKTAQEILNNKNLILKKVLVKDLSKKREIPSHLLTDKASEIFDDESISVVIEVTAGEQPALDFCLQTLNAKKHFVTANKELLAKHGAQIFEVAAKNNVQVGFDGTVAGGIPIINTLQNSLSANQVTEVIGIFNGTSNYILSEMQQGETFENALNKAQELGYAEPDPTNDIEGVDTKYKTAILSSLISGQFVHPDKIKSEGIRFVSTEDLHFAERLNYVIKLLGICQLNESSELTVGVFPAFVSKLSTVSCVNGAINVANIKGSLIEELTLVGPGAGPGPTNSAIVGDLLQIINKQTHNHLVLQNSSEVRFAKEPSYKFFVRLNVDDNMGVIAQIGSILEKHEISLESIEQELQDKSEDDDLGTATMVFITHLIEESKIQ
ncbi:MAG TPA: homoserine dehydrogenase, partial [Vampirovibrionales bacterium]